MRFDDHSGVSVLLCHSIQSISVVAMVGMGGVRGQSRQSSRTRREQVAILVTRPFSNTGAPSVHGVNTFTARLGNVRPMAGLCKSLW